MLNIAKEFIDNEAEGMTKQGYKTNPRNYQKN